LKVFHINVRIKE